MNIRLEMSFFGEGMIMAPRLACKNIPLEADLIIIEFNDKSMPALSKGGGHGAIRLEIENKTEVVVPSIAEQTFDLPEGVEMGSQHRAPLGKAGVHTAPCGCGNENKYEATIFALITAEPGKRMTMGKGKILLGKFQQLWNA